MSSLQRRTTTAGKPGDSLPRLSAASENTFDPLHDLACLVSGPMSPSEADALQIVFALPSLWARLRASTTQEATPPAAIHSFVVKLAARVAMATLKQSVNNKRYGTLRLLVLIIYPPDSISEDVRPILLNYD